MGPLMSLDDFVSYLKTDLGSPSDREKCLDYLKSLDLDKKKTEFAEEILDRWIRVGLFNGTLSADFLCQATTTGVKKYQPSAAYNSAAKTTAAWIVKMEFI